MHKIVRKHWFGLEIYTKNVIFSLNLLHLPKILDTTKNFQKFDLWSSILMQKIKKLCWVDPEKGLENTQRNRTYFIGPLQQSWGYNSTTNWQFFDLQNYKKNEELHWPVSKKQQRRRTKQKNWKYQANFKKYNNENFMYFIFSATKPSTVSAMFCDSKKFSICKW